jgi:hypothetical protein
MNTHIKTALFHNGLFGVPLDLNSKIIFLFLFFPLSAITETQTLQQETKRSIYSATNNQSSNDLIQTLNGGFTHNLAIAPLACAVNNAQQRTSKSISSVTLNYGMTAYPQYPTIDSLSVLVDKNAYYASNLPPFLSIDATIFKTIQEALDHMSYEAAQNSNQIATIFIAQGTYEENLILPSIRALNMVFIGNVSIGTTSAPKNITLSFEDEATPTQLINFIPLTCISTCGQGFYYPSSFTITGNLLIGDNNTPLTTDTLKQISLSSVHVQGETKHGGSSKAIGRTSLYFTNCIFEQACNLSSTAELDYNLTLLIAANACEFQDYLAIDEYGRILNCTLSDGFQAANTIISGSRSFYPYAFINSSINGTVTGLDSGSPLNLYVDETTENNSAYSLSNATRTIVSSSN